MTHGEINLRQLRYFLVVAEELHFGRAAARLHISQPPLSRSIQNLEQKIDTQLFYRSTQRVELTEAGNVLIGEARRLFDRLERTISTTQQAGRGEVGRVQIGFVTTAVYNVLPSLLKSFRKAMPSVEFILRELPSDAQVEALRERLIDVGFLHPPVSAPDIQIETVYKEPLIVALPSSSELAKARKSKSIPVNALRDELFVIAPRHYAPGLFDKIIAMTERAGFSPRITQEAVQVQTIISLVSANFGVSLVPDSWVNLTRPGVTYRRLTPKSPEIETSIAWMEDETRKVVKSFISFVNGRTDS